MAKPSSPCLLVRLAGVPLTRSTSPSIFASWGHLAGKSCEGCEWYVNGHLHLAQACAVTSLHSSNASYFNPYLNSVDALRFESRPHRLDIKQIVYILYLRFSLFSLPLSFFFLLFTCVSPLRPPNSIIQLPVVYRCHLSVLASIGRSTRSRASSLPLPLSATETAGPVQEAPQPEDELATHPPEDLNSSRHANSKDTTLPTRRQHMKEKGRVLRNAVQFLFSRHRSSRSVSYAPGNPHFRTSVTARRGSILGLVPSQEDGWSAVKYPRAH